MSYFFSSSLRYGAMPGSTMAPNQYQRGYAPTLTGGCGRTWIHIPVEGPLTEPGSSIHDVSTG
eukprot:1291251-Rhodomonas_salina.2